MNRLVIGVNAAVLVVLIGVAGWVALGQGRDLADARDANGTLTTQLAQARKDADEAQAALGAARDRLAQSERDLAQAQKDTQAAQTSNKTLGGQLAESQKRAQTAEASAADLKGTNDSLNAKLTQAQKDTQAAQTAKAAADQKITRAIPRAQLVDDFFKFSIAATKGQDVTQQSVDWVGKLVALNDATINRLLGAAASDPKNTDSMYQLLQYLTGSVVDTLK